MVPILRALVRRPQLWPEALRAVTALASRGWWRRPPFLPLPDPAYLGWRLETAYGSRQHRPAPADVTAYLEWRRRFRRG